MAQRSGISYGDSICLQNQLEILKGRYNAIGGDEMTKWLKLCTTPNFYKEISDVLHFALSCFVKVPLEAPAETIGSVINQHGRKERCSLKMANLSSEVQVAWNGPAEYDPAAQTLINQALEEYFTEHTISKTARFYTTAVVKCSSSTISKFMKKKSRINFN